MKYRGLLNPFIMDSLAARISALDIQFLTSLMAFVPALFNIGIIFYILFKLPRNKTTDIFTFFVLAMVIWQLEDSALRLPISMASAQVSDGILCIGGFAMAPLLLHFTLRFVHLEKFYSRSTLWIVYTPFVFFYILYMTNLHGMEYLHDKTWGWSN